MNELEGEEKRKSGTGDVPPDDPTAEGAATPELDSAAAQPEGEETGIEARQGEAKEAAEDGATAEIGSEPAVPDDAEGPDPLANLEAGLAETRNELLRALAETENIRKRAERERADVGKFAITGFARDLLGVADNLRRAIESVPDEMRGDAALATLVDGITLTEKELLTVFDRNKIQKIDPLGEKFDHNLHQAMFEVPGTAPSGTIVQVVQTGYVIADRLLRPALVGVAAAPKEEGSQPKAEPGQHVDTEA